MSSQDIVDMLETTGAYLQNGHFKLISGNHSDSYVHVRLALAYPEYASQIGKKLAGEFQEERIAVVVAFTVGGRELAESVAKHLEARFVRAEVKEEKIVLSKGHAIQQGENVLVVDDVLTTGQLIHEALATILDNTQGVPRGVGVVVDRSQKTPDFGVKTVSLATIAMNLWPTESCPKCQQGIPITDLSSPDKQPLSILKSLPQEIRPVFAMTYKEYLEEIKAGKELAEVLKVYRPTHEFPGGKPDRVAILGSFDRMGMMIKLGKYVASLGYYAITSKLLFEKKSGRTKELRPYLYESMNDFLRRMIYSCQFIIVVYTEAGGQYIETAWCSESNKPTLGLAECRPPKYSSLESCKYLRHDESQKILFCLGLNAWESGDEVAGGWICDKNETCPFPSSGLTKMILDLYTTSRTMFLLGSDHDENFEIPIPDFLENKGRIQFPS